MPTYSPINDVTLEAISNILGDTSKGLVGSEIAKLLGEAGIDDVEPEITKRVRLFKALQTNQKDKKCSNNVLDFVKRVMNPQKYLNNPTHYEFLRGEINKALGFAGYKLNKSGEIEILNKTTTSLDDFTQGSVPELNKSIFKVFVSHSSKDVSYATFIKTYLSYNFQMDAFVAHEDIEPSTEWVDEILKVIMSKECGIFISLISQNYKRSEWCNQEAGIAYSLKKKIIPIKLSIKDMGERGELTKNGFMNKYQLLKWQSYGSYENHDRDKTNAHNFAILLRAFYKQRIVDFDQLISSVGTSYTWWDAQEKLSLILELEEEEQKVGTSLLDESRIVKLVEKCNEDQNVYNSLSARRHIDHILEKYKKFIPEELAASLKERLG